MLRGMVAMGGSGTIRIDSSFDVTLDDTSQTDNNTVVAEGQSFVSQGGTLKSAKFWLAKLGAPTGNVTACLYASTGAVGSKVGTGTVLDTSATINITTLAVAFSRNLETFTFSGGYHMTAGTTYIITAEFVGGDGSNALVYFGDSTASDTNGNPVFRSLAGSWGVATFPHDICYYVYALPP